MPNKPKPYFQVGIFEFWKLGIWNVFRTKVLSRKCLPGKQYVDLKTTFTTSEGFGAWLDYLVCLKDGRKETEVD